MSAEKERQLSHTTTPESSDYVVEVPKEWYKPFSNEQQFSIQDINRENNFLKASWKDPQTGETVKAEYLYDQKGNPEAFRILKENEALIMLRHEQSEPRFNIFYRLRKNAQPQDASMIISLAGPQQYDYVLPVPSIGGAVYDSISAVDNELVNYQVILGEQFSPHDNRKAPAISYERRSITMQDDTNWEYIYGYTKMTEGMMGGSFSQGQGSDNSVFLQTQHTASKEISRITVPFRIDKQDLLHVAFSQDNQDEIPPWTKIANLPVSFEHFKAFYSLQTIYNLDLSQDHLLETKVKYTKKREPQDVFVSSTISTRQR